MSSNASEARKFRPGQRKRSKDHDISNHKYTRWDKQASVGTLPCVQSRNYTSVDIILDLINRVLIVLTRSFF
jgi:hypothetical protein